VVFAVSWAERSETELIPAQNLGLKTGPDIGRMNGLLAFKEFACTALI
jgi:hypothetical protein